MPAPDARVLLEALKGQTLRTPVEHEPNDIKGFRGSLVVVGTETNPDGAGVSISLVQNALNEIYDGRVHVLNRKKRSAFLAAVLGTLDEVEVTTEGTWSARLKTGSPGAKADRLIIAALDAQGGDATRQELVTWALEHGEFDRARLTARGGERSQAEQELLDALARAVEAGTVERPERGEYRLPTAAPATVAVPVAAQSNPDWTFDELILALSLYLRWRPSQPPAGHDDLVALSDLLQRLPIHPLDARAEDFRNANSVRRKLGDYTAPDPTYAGRGTKGGSGVHLVWNQFAEDPLALSAAVARITASAGQPTLPPPDEDEAEAVEGRILIGEHRVRERDPALVRKRKADAVKAHGRLVCEVCDLDFHERYGDLGAGFMEAHHTLPLAVGAVRVTRAEDLALLCANCHRMIHRARPILSVRQLRERLRT